MLSAAFMKLSRIAALMLGYFAAKDTRNEASSKSDSIPDADCSRLVCTASELSALLRIDDNTRRRSKSDSIVATALKYAVRASLDSRPRFETEINSSASSKSDSM